MVTDIYGGIEVRDARRGPDGPWVLARDLQTLLGGGGGPAGAYPAFAFLFGARNRFGFEPVAAARGLPDDVSRAIRDELQPGLDSGELTASWLAFSEIADLDLDGPFGPFVAWVAGAGRVELLRGGWTPDDITFGEPPSDIAARAADGPVTWTTGAGTYSVTPMTLGTYFGPGAPWGRVVALMRGLAERSGPDGVRLVAAFD